MSGSPFIDIYIDYYQLHYYVTFISSFDKRGTYRVRPTRSYDVIILIHLCLCGNKAKHYYRFPNNNNHTYHYKKLSSYSPYSFIIKLDAKNSIAAASIAYATSYNQITNTIRQST